MKEYKGFAVDDDLNIYNARTGNKLTPHVGSDGYCQVTKREADGKLTHERVHRIIASVFVDNPHGYNYVNHIDSDKTNNSVENLEWCTNAYNVYHGWHSGNRYFKNNTHVSAIDRCGVRKDYASIREMCKDLHIDRHKVSRILKGEIGNRYDYKFVYTDECETTIERQCKQH